MKKATIIFGSTTGNTEIVADKIAETMTGYDVQVIYVTDAKDDTAVKEADLVLYGCSTMGLGELQDDFIPYYENRMTPALLKGKNVAVFGLGDKENYEDYFCWAADILSKKVTECGANLVCPPLKVDGEPDDNEAAVNLHAALWPQMVSNGTKGPLHMTGHAACSQAACPVFS